MLYFIEMTLLLTDVTLEVMHSASKHDSIHMWEILCEPLSSKCPADKSLTWIFYSWRPSQNGYHFRNSPCANTSCSVSLVPCVPGRCQQRSVFHLTFAKKFYDYDYFLHSFLWKQKANPRREAVNTRKWDPTQLLTARWNPVESGEIKV